MNMSKTWCPDCAREVINLVGFIADGWEFTCGKCNQRFVVRFERSPTLREAAQQSAQPTVLTACGICGNPAEGGRAICLSCANTQTGYANR